MLAQQHDIQLVLCLQNGVVLDDQLAPVGCVLHPILPVLGWSFRELLFEFAVFLLEVFYSLDQLLLDLAGESVHLVLEFIKRSDCLLDSLKLVDNDLALAAVLEVDLHLQPDCYLAASLNLHDVREGDGLAQGKLDVLEQFGGSFYVIAMVLDVLLLDLLSPHPQKIRVAIVPILHRHLEDLAGVDAQFNAIVPRHSLDLCAFEALILHV